MKRTSSVRQKSDCCIEHASGTVAAAMALNVSNVSSRTPYRSDRNWPAYTRTYVPTTSFASTYTMAGFDNSQRLICQLFPCQKHKAVAKQGTVSAIADFTLLAQGLLFCQGEHIVRTVTKVSNIVLTFFSFFSPYVLWMRLAASTSSSQRYTACK